MFVTLLLLSFLFESRAEEEDPGIGMVFHPNGDNKTTIIHSNPNDASDTIAILSDGEYTFPNGNARLTAFLVGFSKYDYRGLPILSITQDSSWALVSVESFDGTRKTEGWVNLKIPNTSIRIWADFLVTQSMQLREDRPIRFYSKPNRKAEWKIKLFRYPDRKGYSYLLQPIRREGRWLLVELQTPFSPCDGWIEGGARIIRVWIEYLDKQMRPLVQAPLMC